jgi:hypothetical protein
MIKDYAETNSESLSEAYTEVLRAGLGSVETQDEQYLKVS